MIFNISLRNTAAAAMIALGVGSVSAATITVGALYDLTGEMNIYGIQQSNTVKLAVDYINKNGGINGDAVKLIEYDTQSDDAKYTQFATTLAIKDKVKAIFGGLTSSSREAVRPVARKFKIPYFYGAVYEGGVCDRYNIVVGITASQGMIPLLDWATSEYGNRYYIVAPNYNFGTLSAHWVHEYAKNNGGTVVGEDFLPVSQSNFSSTIQKIQNAKPDVVVALPVGAKQTSFYEQFAAAGLKSKIGVVSTNFGSGNQQVVVSPEAGDGIVSAQNYFMVVDQPSNEEFLEEWRNKYGEIKEPIISVANDVWNAVMLWVEAVKQAGTADSEPVIDTILNGVTLYGPEGQIKSLPSNHLEHQVYLVRGNKEHGFDVISHNENVVPLYEAEQCNLLENPDINTQFTPE